MLLRSEKLLALNHLVSSCTRCEIAGRRTQVVFGEGNVNSRLIIVGEGPGAEEDQTGRPFVGKAGKLLNRAIIEAGLNREDLYITNTVKCRACDWVNNKPINRAPSKQEAANCREWLEQQFQILEPKVVLCIGAPSAKNLIRKDFKITTERGVFFDSAKGWKLMASIHPSYILRLTTKTSDGGFHHLVNDLRSAWDVSQS